MRKITLKLQPITIGKYQLKTRSIPFNLNQLNRMHWGERKKWKDGWKEEVGWAIKQFCSVNKVSIPFPIKRHKENKKPIIQFIFYCIRRQDQDNANAAIKPLLDGLSDMKVIKDDSPDHIILKPVKQIKVSKKEDEHIEIIIS